MTLAEYRDALLEYLEEEKALIQEDIERDERLTEGEKVDKGLLLKDCRLVRRDGSLQELSVAVNNSKLRPGDKVSLESQGERGHIDATIVENGFDSIVLTASMLLRHGVSYDIHVKRAVMLDTLISLLSGIDDGLPGATFLKILAGCAEPERAGLGGLRSGERHIPATMNDRQREACLAAFPRPSVHCVQGPPGTGKTDVLAAIANAFSAEGKTVLVMSNTHQAVNNALSKVSRANTVPCVVKLGSRLKGQGLPDGTTLLESLGSYLSMRRSRKRKPGMPGDVVGMTLQGALVNMGLRSTGINPSIVLVDEAGQMPLVEAAALGTFGSGSMVFIGDDRQMPPIFHERLQGHELSTSIFSFLAGRFPGFRTTLNVTYRMNGDITRLVSSRFYEPYGIRLEASGLSRDRRLRVEADCGDPRISRLLSSGESLLQLDVTTDGHCKDMNMEEAWFIASLAAHAAGGGIAAGDMAIITPFRRQVRAIRNCCAELLGELPLIDTVERLQGEDVDLIIMSMCVSDGEYFNDNRNFLLNPNRLNVMFSRARRKVIVLAPATFGRLV